MRNTLTSLGSDDTWQTCKTRGPIEFVGPKAEFSVLIEKSEQTTNAWKFMIGVAPETFTCTGSRQWLGSQNSWGYIGGTGGKCYNVGKSSPYGEKFGAIGKPGDLITTVMDTQQQTIEWLLNGKTQGVAFNNFVPRGSNMYAACSITAAGSRVRLVERITPKSGPSSVVGGGILQQGLYVLSFFYVFFVFVFFVIFFFVLFFVRYERSFWGLKNDFFRTHRWL